MKLLPNIVIDSETDYVTVDTKIFGVQLKKNSKQCLRVLMEFGPDLDDGTY